MKNERSSRMPIGLAPSTVKVAPYSYLKFWVFYATFGLAKFTTNTLKTRQSDYFENTHNVLNCLGVKNIIQF